MKKDIVFIFNKDCKKAFKEFKVRLTFTSILDYYDLKQKIMLKLNALNEIIAGIFLQLDLRNE